MPDAAPQAELRLAGYFPKQVVTRPEWLRCPAVMDVCSMSGCISAEPDDWIDRWLHNELWLYDTPELARSVAPPSDSSFTVFAYRVSVIRFVDGQPQAWPWPPTVSPIALPPGYRSLGFDVVGKLMDDIAGWEHSPLSCNHMADEYPVNAHCLLDDVGQAFAAARDFSIDKPEPGMYYVVDVLVEPGARLPAS